MSVDDTSSQDSALIDDDLVEALGFEPVTTLVSDDDSSGEYSSSEETNGHVVDELTFGDPDESANGDAVGSANGDADVIDDVEDLDVAGDVAAAAGAMVAAVAQTSTEDDQEIDADDLVGLIGNELTIPDVEPYVEPDGDDLARKADELLDSHRDDISVVDDDIELFDESELFDEPELFDADVDAADRESDESLDPTAAEPVVDAAGSETGVWADEEDSIVLLNDGGQAGAREPIIDLSDDDPVALTEAVADVRDPYADYELATPESVFAESPTSPPTTTQPAVSPVRREPRDSSGQPRTKRLRARKSRRVIRHIDPWSVLTFSVLFHMFVFAALLLGSVLVWNAAIASGMVENVESFIQELGDYETFEINADVMFKAAIVVAGMLTLASSVLVVLLTVVFNLISDLVGGIRVTVIEEETVRVPVKKKSLKSE